jgi:uncharacterized metal-binding protein YceD (DUF177 family)
MDDQFAIFVEQLRNGRERIIHESLSPAFLEINEPELSCDAPVDVEGEAYLAEDSLVVHFSRVTTSVWIPCSICNSLVAVPVELDNFYHSELLAQIPTGIYSFKEILRETLLLEVPHFAECEGSCPRRKEIGHYLKSDSSTDALSAEGYQPFADLDEQLNKTDKKNKTKK